MAVCLANILPRETKLQQLQQQPPSSTNHEQRNCSITKAEGLLRQRHAQRRPPLLVSRSDPLWTTIIHHIGEKRKSLSPRRMRPRSHTRVLPVNTSPQPSRPLLSSKSCSRARVLPPPCPTKPPKSSPLPARRNARQRTANTDAPAEPQQMPTFFPRSLTTGAGGSSASPSSSSSSPSANTCKNQEPKFRDAKQRHQPGDMIRNK